MASKAGIFWQRQLLNVPVACPTYAADVMPAGDARTASVTRQRKNVENVCPVDEVTAEIQFPWKDSHQSPPQELLVHVGRV